MTDSNQTDEQALYTAAAFGEHQRGNGHRDPDVSEWAGVVRDEQVSRCLSVLAERYDPADADRPEAMPGRAAELGEVRRMRRVAADEVARQAMETGDYTSLKHLTGNQQQQADVSGLKAIQRVRDLVTGPAPVIVFLGDMGAGKTDATGLFGQIWEANQSGDVQIASNIRSLRETTPWKTQDGERRDGWVANLPELEDWLQQDGDPLDHEQTPKLFIGDEFSSSGSGTGKQGHKVRKHMGPLVFKVRKWGGTLFYVGHDESSIHPLMVRVGKVVKKVSKKKAVVADTIKNGELRNIEMELTGIPQTDWTYDTNEASDWSWSRSGADGGSDDYEPDDAARDVAIWTAIRCKEQGMTNDEAAKFVPYSDEWVRLRWKEYREEDKHESALARVEDVTA